MSVVTLNVFTLLQLFAGNQDGESITSNSLCPDLTARVLRIYPLAWNTIIAMRVGVVASKNGKLCYVCVTAFFIVPMVIFVGHWSYGEVNLLRRCFSSR